MFFYFFIYFNEKKWVMYSFVYVNIKGKRKLLIKCFFVIVVFFFDGWVNQFRKKNFLLVLVLDQVRYENNQFVFIVYKICLKVVFMRLKFI